MGLDSEDNGIKALKVVISDFQGSHRDCDVRIYVLGACAKQPSPCSCSAAVQQRILLINSAALSIHSTSPTKKQKSLPLG